MPPRSPPWKSKSSHKSCSASYLSDLRNNRPARPTGSRPAPFKTNNFASTYDHAPLLRSESAPVQQPQETIEVEKPVRRNPFQRHSVVSNPTPSPIKGRPIAQPNANSIPSIRGRNFSPTATILPSTKSDDHGDHIRKEEKEESHQLREALEEIDQQDEETRIYLAAQQEAADLVWKHCNPKAAEGEKVAAYRNPDLPKKEQITRRLHGSQSELNQSFRHSRSGSIEPMQPGHSRSNSLAHEYTKRGSIGSSNLAGSPRQQTTSVMEQSKRFEDQEKKSRRRSGGRLVSNGSSKGVFKNPEDQIYEEPGELVQQPISEAPEESTKLALRTKNRNSLPRTPRPLPGKPLDDEIGDKPKIDRYEIYRNPPTQSRNASYLANDTPPRQPETVCELPSEGFSPQIEMRDDDIRAATSMRRKDRSPNLPTPSAVSDRFGRPIVSFDPNWRPPSDSPRGSIDMEQSPVRRKSNTPFMVVSAPDTPIINLPDESTEIPTIVLPNDNGDLMPGTSTKPSQSLPTINVSLETHEHKSMPKINEPTQTRTTPSINVRQSSASSQPIPSINVSSDRSIQKSRPLPAINHGNNSAPSVSNSRPGSKTPAPPSRTNRVPWMNGPSVMTGPTVTCNACYLPISGRIVTASGASSTSPKARFHPGCFTCHHCHTALECVSFYPEPEKDRTERLLAEQQETNSDISPAMANAANSDLRFYCHLDFHEFFSPRCRSCKTPIEGEVILAAGHSWHVGHFFCGECGDPFDSHTPFVESHDGYAYCVRCHTRRTSARCRGCKNVILDELTVEALGAKWHEHCFVCFECAGGFGDDGRFFVRDVPVEVTEKERRRGLTRKLEERAVCVGCEERRLKA